jgi:hypothetical protein
VAGLLAGGAGVVGLGVGAYFGVRAFSKQGVVDDHCHGALCDATGLDADDDAHTSAAVSTIAFVAGAALAAGGAVLFFTAGDFPAGRAAGAGVWLAPRVGSLGADLRLGGAW